MRLPFLHTLPRGARVEHLLTLEAPVVEQLLLHHPARGAVHRGGDHGGMVRCRRVSQFAATLPRPQDPDREPARQRARRGQYVAGRQGPARSGRPEKG